MTENAVPVTEKRLTGTDDSKQTAEGADSCCRHFKAGSEKERDDPEQTAEGADSCCGHFKARSEKERKDLIRRLSIIEGQIRGIRGMVEKDIYCIDILNQVSAANCALNSFSKALLSEHIRTCVADDIREGSEQKLDELLKTLPKLMR